MPRKRTDRMVFRPQPSSESLRSSSNGRFQRGWTLQSQTVSHGKLPGAVAVRGGSAKEFIDIWTWRPRREVFGDD